MNFPAGERLAEEAGNGIMGKRKICSLCIGKRMKAILKFIVNLSAVCLLFSCGRQTEAAVQASSEVPGKDYVEHEAVLILQDGKENHQPHESDSLIDQGEVLMNLSDNRKIVLVRDETRTAKELVRFVKENDRVVSAELNRISEMTEVK